MDTNKWKHKIYDNTYSIFKIRSYRASPLFPLKYYQ